MSAFAIVRYFSTWTCVLSERNHLRDLARSKPTFWVEFSECQDTRGKGPGPSAIRCHAHCLWGIEALSDLEVCSPGGLNLCPCPDCELSFDELPLSVSSMYLRHGRFPGIRGLEFFGFPSALLGKCRETSALPPVSRHASNHVHSLLPCHAMPCQAPGAALRHTCVLGPTLEWRHRPPLF